MAEKKPQLTQATTQNYVNRLSDFDATMVCFKVLQSSVEKLVEAMHQYVLYLESHNARVLQAHLSPEPI